MRKNIFLMLLLLSIVYSCERPFIFPYSTLLVVQIKSAEHGFIFDKVKTVTKRDGQFLDPSPLLYKAKFNFIDGDETFSEGWYNDIRVLEDKEGHKCLTFYVSNDRSYRDFFTAEIELFAPDVFEDEEFHKMIFKFAYSAPNSFNLISSSYNGVEGRMEDHDTEINVLFSVP